MVIGISDSKDYSELFTILRVIEVFCVISGIFSGLVFAEVAQFKVLIFMLL